MQKMRLIALAGIVAGLAAGCGGGDADHGSGSTVLAGTIGAASPTIKTARFASVKFGGGGYVPGLIFHPTSPDVLYARTDVGGAYRWDAATKSWIAITDGFGPDEGGYHGSETMALDPNDDQRVYMSGGMYDSADGHARLYISTDRGDHWTHVELPFSAGSNNQGRAVGERLMVDPNDPTILFYGTRTAGLWKSTDRGQTWSQVTSLSPAKMTQAQVDATYWSSPVGVEQVIFDTNTKGTGSATQTIYTAVAPDYAGVAGLNYALYKTTDGGASWTGIATPADVAGFVIPHMVRAKDGVMYVAFTKGIGPGANGPARLYKFDGTNWTLLKRYDDTQWSSFGMGGLSVYGTGANTRIALGVTNSWGNWQGQSVVQLSDDGGATWREIAAMMPHVPADGGFSGWVDDVEIDPNNKDRILHVTGGGVVETRNASDPTPTWTFPNDGIEEVASKALMTPPAGANYTLLRSGLDVGTFVQTELTKHPTRAPGGFSSTFGVDTAWSNPAYIATIGAATWGQPDNLGAYSMDSGVTWAAFATNHPDAKAHQSETASIAVTKAGNAVWAPAESVPAWTADNGNTWTYTNLPALPSAGISRGYHVVADRKNPNKVYAYDSGGSWWMQWGGATHFFTSTDGGHTFTESTTFATSGASLNSFQETSVAVNPNAEGDVWVVDGFTILHSTDSGAHWTKLNVTQSIPDPNNYFQPKIFGATSIALGKAPVGAKYSASIYIAGVISGQWGLYRSDDGGVNWTRYNDDLHQYAGIGLLAADQTVPGRVYFAGAARGVLFTY
ncbi:dockerin [Massilia pinisoli]|uniref:Dockerin n=1 Tax=Massilia pinisoli TaxID=1772194 RepID=A0ABT1ZSA5_9BURK|nr:dockerin [Massilia pinisoli]MCS0582770.1 dockerin [Massilia pinisoli]